MPIILKNFIVGRYSFYAGYDFKNGCLILETKRVVHFFDHQKQFSQWILLLDKLLELEVRKASEILRRKGL